MEGKTKIKNTKADSKWSSSKSKTFVYIGSGELFVYE